jgi:glycosyltransferase involved in cell wall biosynthesis
MIEAAKCVVRKSENAYFVIFGEGFLRRTLEDKIEDAGLKRRFFLPGFRNDLQSVLREIDVFVLPSFSEGLPNVVLEALVERKPVVATSVGGTPEIITHGVSGFLTAPEDVNKMAEFILRLIRNPRLRRTIGENGYHHVREHFGFERQTALYEELYARIGAAHGLSLEKASTWQNPVSGKEQ